MKQDMSEPHKCQCLEKFEAVQNVQWEQIKTLSALMKRIEKEGDRLQELFHAADYERQQMRIAFIEQYLRKRLEKIVPGDKKGAKSDNRCTFKKAERNVS